MKSSVWKRVVFASLCVLLSVVLAACGDDDDGQSKDSTNNQSNPPATCGNGSLDEGEVCDGTALAGETCATQGTAGGQLGCKSSCLEFDRSGCEAPQTCGDGTLQEGEVCDGENLDGVTCQSRGFDQGTVSCASNCLEVDTSACSDEGQCVPKTCDDLGAQCGSTDDGCGGTLDCGGCTGDLSCGGSGEPNVCGASCRSGCPDGFSCSTEGVCTGDSDTIVANMPTATVSLVAKLDGQTPQPEDYCEAGEFDLATVTLRSLTGGDYSNYGMPCDGSPLEVVVPQDTYQVTVRGQQSTDMPAWSYQTHESLEIDADTTVTANMPTATVNLVAKLDGQTPQPEDYCEADEFDLATVTLRSLTGGDYSNYGMPCDGSPLEVVVPQDTYQVTVRGQQSTDMPAWSYQTHESLEIDADTTVTANMPTATVNLVAKLDGQTPQPEDYCEADEFDLATVTLRSLTGGDYSNYGMPCDGSPLEVVVPQDTYQVTVRGQQSTDMPAWSYQTHESLEIDADTTVTANVPTATVNLVAKLDGQTPQPEDYCEADEFDLATVTLRSLTGGDYSNYGMPCDGSPLEVVVPQDTYQVTVRGQQSTDMPAWSYQTHESLEIDADTTVTANMPTATVNLVAKLDGQTPQPEDYCEADEFDLATVTLRSLTGGDYSNYGMPCDGSPLEVVVPQDTYQVTVRGQQSTDMPAWSYQTHESLEIDADTTVTANMPTATVNLVAKLDGQTPQPEDYCEADEFDLATVTLRSLTGGDYSNYGMPCDGSPLEVVVPKDTYQVTVRGQQSTDMPAWSYEAIWKIEIR